LSKCDAVLPEDLAARTEALRRVARKKPLVLSSVAQIGVKEALYALTREITRADAAEVDPDADTAWSP
jgi:GTPase